MLSFFVLSTLIVAALFIARAMMKKAETLRKESHQLGAMLNEQSTESQSVEDHDWLSAHPVMYSGDLHQDSLWERRE